MQFYRELAVRFFNVEFAGIRFDLEGIVVYPVYHHAGDMCWMCSVWQNVLVVKFAVVVDRRIKSWRTLDDEVNARLSCPRQARMRNSRM